MSKDSDKFFMPKSIFKGTNSKGEKFKLTEWEPGSIGHLTGDGNGMMFGVFMMIILGTLAISLVLPILLLYCVFTYNGRIQKQTFVGIIISIYGLYDFHKHWFVWVVNKAFLGLGNLPMVKSIMVASIFAQIALIGVTLVTKGSMYDNEYANRDNEGTTFHPKVVVTAIISFIISLMISLLIFKYN